MQQAKLLINGIVNKTEAANPITNAGDNLFNFYLFLISKILGKTNFKINKKIENPEIIPVTEAVILSYLIIFRFINSTCSPIGVISKSNLVIFRKILLFTISKVFSSLVLVQYLSGKVKENNKHSGKARKVPI